MSKQVPLLLVSEVRDPERQPNDKNQEVEIIKVMFKYGDDLR